MILFDGCSFTFGDELENPEKDAFPHLVSRMGLSDGAKPRIYKSIGECGKSNDGILRTTINFCENNPVTLAVIQFTNFSRREVMNSGKDSYFRRKFRSLILWDWSSNGCTRTRSKGF